MSKTFTIEQLESLSKKYRNMSIDGFIECLKSQNDFHILNEICESLVGSGLNKFQRKFFKLYLENDENISLNSLPRACGKTTALAILTIFENKKNTKIYYKSLTHKMDMNFQRILEGEVSFLAPGYHRSIMLCDEILLSDLPPNFQAKSRVIELKSFEF